MSSLSICSGSHHSGASAINSCHQWSLPSFMTAPESLPTRSTTTTFSMEGEFSTASSAFFFRGTIPPRR